MPEFLKPKKWPRMNPKRSKDIPQKSKDEVRERSRGRCEAHLPGCPGLAEEFHHKKKKSHGGSHDAKNLLHVARHCHELIEDMAPGTEAYRTFSFQKEGMSELDFKA